MTYRPLNERQRLFVEAYLVSGSPKQAAIAAGYSAKTASVIGSENLQKPAIAAAIKLRQDLEAQALAEAITATATTTIATRAERQQFWSDVVLGRMQDRNGLPCSMRDRLKASELLGRSQADFIDKTEVTGANGGPIAIGTVVLHEFVTRS